MLEAFGISDPGCVRQNNEDFYLIAPNGAYIVADGMGGAQAGEHASKLAVETVASFLENAPAPDAETLFQAFREANARVMKEAASHPELEGMGTTLVAAMEYGPELLIDSVGDSRAYVYNGGQLTVITEDQTWVNEVGRKLGIDEASLRIHPMRHVLTMAIGVSPEVRVQSYTVRPPPGALILLSTDGLHGVIEQGVIADKLSGNGSLQAKCERLIDAAKQAGGPDNITVVLLQAK
jgi:PPM family protein phosphatase